MWPRYNEHPGQQETCHHPAPLGGQPDPWETHGRVGIGANDPIDGRRRAKVASVRAKVASVTGLIT